MSEDKFGNIDPDTEEIKDNRGWLPTWWMWLLYGAIIYSVGYIIYMHGIVGWNQHTQYQNEVKAVEKMKEAAGGEQLALTSAGVNPLRGDEKAIAAGKDTFQNGPCAACHLKDATGSTGPDLTDATWLHGNTDKKVFNVIVNGVSVDEVKQKPSKGPMTAHGFLGNEKILQIMAWIAEINDTLEPQ